MAFWRCLSGLQEHRYAYILTRLQLTEHTEEYPKFILASIIFDVLHPIPNNQLEFQLVSTFVLICSQRWSLKVVASVCCPCTLIAIWTFVSCVRGLLSPASLNMRARATLPRVVLLLRIST